MNITDKLKQSEFLLDKLGSTNKLKIYAKRILDDIFIQVKLQGDGAEVSISKLYQNTQYYTGGTDSPVVNMGMAEILNQPLLDTGIDWQELDQLLVEKYIPQYLSAELGQLLVGFTEEMIHVFTDKYKQMDLSSIFSEMTRDKQKLSLGMNRVLEFRSDAESLLSGLYSSYPEIKARKFVSQLSLSEEQLDKYSLFSYIYTNTRTDNLHIDKVLRIDDDEGNYIDTRALICAGLLTYIEIPNNEHFKLLYKTSSYIFKS